MAIVTRSESWCFKRLVETNRFPELSRFSDLLQDFPVLENAEIKFQDFPGPARTLHATNNIDNVCEVRTIGHTKKHWCENKHCRILLGSVHVFEKWWAQDCKYFLKCLCSIIKVSFESDTSMILALGCSRKKSTHRRLMGFWKFLQERGQIPWKSRRGRGLNLKSLLKGSFWLIHVVHAIRALSLVTLQHSQTRKIVELHVFCPYISHLT